MADTHLVYKCSDYAKLGELGRKVFDAFGARNKIEEQNSLLRNSARFENLYGHCGGAA